MPHAATVVSVILAASAIFLLVLGAASMMALFKGASELRRLFRAASGDYSAVLLKSPLVPGVSVLVVARDASAEARALVRRLLDLHFGKHELILVLDGPSDVARAQWVEELHLLPQERTERHDLPAKPVRAFYVSREPLKLLVVDKEEGGDADALNAAINAAQYPVLGMVDPRAEFIPEWMLRLMRPLLENWDHTAAVCAAALPAPVEGLAGRIGRLEALRRWMVRGAAFARWRKLVPIPGCCMLIKREPVVAAGGVRGGILELFLDLHAGKQQITFLPSPVSWDKAPATIVEVREHMRYDQAQLVQGLRYRPARAGGEFTGLFCVRVIRPVLETVSLPLAAAGLALGWVDPALAGLTLLASAGVGVALSTAAVVLREMVDPGLREPGYMARLFLTAIPENLGYRQVRNLWLIAAFFRR